MEIISPLLIWCAGLVRLLFNFTNPPSVISLAKVRRFIKPTVER